MIITLEKKIIFILIFLVFTVNINADLIVNLKDIKYVNIFSSKAILVVNESTRIISDTNEMTKNLLDSMSVALNSLWNMKRRGINDKKYFSNKASAINEIFFIDFSKIRLVLKILFLKDLYAFSFIKRNVFSFLFKMFSRRIIYNQKKFRYLIGIGGYKQEGIVSLNNYISNGITAMAF